jgi:hypothetical protein
MHEGGTVDPKLQIEAFAQQVNEFPEYELGIVKSSFGQVVSRRRRSVQELAQLAGGYRALDLLVLFVRVRRIALRGSSR